jgi:hypothetical protein
LIAIVPLALVHALGNLFTNLSLGKVAVSFTHTIKAMEPFFSVLLSSLFLGDVSASLPRSYFTLRQLGPHFMQPRRAVLYF